MPLPLYIDRPDEDADKERYQTVYNQKPGAVAAPTAGLHFDEPLLEQIRAKGVEMAFVTLHVGRAPSSRCASTRLKITTCTRNTPKCPRRWWMPSRRPAPAAVGGCGGHHVGAILESAAKATGPGQAAGALLQ